MLDGEPKKASDLELLARLRSLAWLSVAQQKRLAAAMTSYDVARDELIFSDSAGQGSDLFILLSGAARFSRFVENPDFVGVLLLVRPMAINYSLWS
jgi:hypothetical protein